MVARLARYVAQRMDAATWVLVTVLFDHLADVVGGVMRIGLFRAGVLWV
jgi:hypothetical protein